jgi:transposase
VGARPIRYRCGVGCGGLPDADRTAGTRPLGWRAAGGQSATALDEPFPRFLAGAGKSDPIDALAVARVVLREPDLPVARHDAVSMELRLLVDRREDLVRQRAATINRLLGRVHQLDPVWAKPRNWDYKRPREQLGAWLTTQEGLLAELARDEFKEIVRLSEGAEALARRIGERVRTAAPALLTLQGCGELTAAKIVAEVAGIERFKSEAAFARHIGVAPIPRWSGQTTRPLRPIRHGNRQLNTAVHRIAIGVDP